MGALTDVLPVAARGAGLPHRTFFGLSVVAGVSWAAYSSVIAVLAASFVEGNPLLAVAVALTLALVLSAVTDRVLGATRRRAEVVVA